jgi:hypothetical protein
MDTTVPPDIGPRRGVIDLIAARGAPGLGLALPEPPPELDPLLGLGPPPT